MIIIIILMFSTIGTSTNKIHCPTSSWTSYKNVKEKSWSIFEENWDPRFIIFTLFRRSNYHCSTDGLITFKTYRDIIFTPKLKINTTTIQFRPDKLIYSEEMHDMYNVTLVLCHRRNSVLSNGYVTKWMQWSNFHKFHRYEVKNCNKLYWTSWNETTTCNSSILHSYSRTCVDCDEQSLNPKYCVGNATKQEQCQPNWGNWSEPGPCVTNSIVDCNRTGERVRTRKCLYGDGSEAPNVRLCSDEPPGMRERCFIKATACVSKPEPLHFGIYIGAFAAFSLLSLFCYFVNLFRNRFLLLKCNQSQALTEQIQLDIEHHTYDIIQDIAGSTIRNIETFETFGPNNRHIKSSKQIQTRSSNKCSRKKADPLGLLEGYEIPINFRNLNNRNDSALDPYSYAQENPTCENRSVTKNDIEEKSYISGAISNIPNVGYVTMKPILPK